MNYQLFRYILTPTQVSLLSNPQLNSLSKHDIMLKMMSEKFDFKNRASSFAYRMRKKLNDNLLIANIGKKAIVEHDLKVNDKFESKDEEEWPFVNLAMNLDDRIQIFALEVNQSKIVNSPLFVLQSFAKSINEKLKEFGWTIFFEPIIDEHKFWEIVGKYHGKIKSIKFTYYVPNLFGVHDKLNEELDSLKTDYSAQKVEAEISNEEGNLFVPKSAFIEESVEHVRKGSGKYSFSIKGLKRRIRSESEFKHVEIDSVRLESSDKETVINALQEILKG